MTCERTCATCAHWSNTEPAMATGIRRAAGADQAIGTCLFSAPTVLSLAGVVVSQWPQTHADRHCGEWTEHAGGPDNGERAGDDRTNGLTVTPFRRAA